MSQECSLQSAQCKCKDLQAMAQCVKPIFKVIYYQIKSLLEFAFPTASCVCVSVVAFFFLLHCVLWQLCYPNGTRSFSWPRIYLSTENFNAFWLRNVECFWTILVVYPRTNNNHQPHHHSQQQPLGVNSCIWLRRLHFHSLDFYFHNFLVRIRFVEVSAMSSWNISCCIRKWRAPYSSSANEIAFYFVVTFIPMETPDDNNVISISY